ncbi:hypothetical protein [Rhodoflexus sp.]
MNRKQKHLFLLFICLCTAMTVRAQSIFDQWAELKSFHSVMSQTFHPSEEGDLKPIKARSKEMADKAKVLAQLPIPASFNNPDIQKAVQTLAKDSKSLHRLVKSGKATDEQIKKSLSDLHDVFHQIVGLCKHENH